mgnify:FL=1
MELTRVSASSPATPSEPENTPQEQGLFGSWLEVHFRDLYSTDEKRNLVAELLVDGSRRGEFQPLLGWTFSDPPPGRVAGIPVRGCRVDASRWTSPRGTGVDAVRLHLSQSPGTQRVGLILMESLPRWGDTEDARAASVTAALEGALPRSIHWDADWLELNLATNTTVSALAIYAETRDGVQAIRSILKPVDVELSAFAVGGIWDAQGRPVPVLLQPAGVRDERAVEWAQRACLYALDTIFKSWSARRAVTVLLDYAEEADTSWEALEGRMGVSLRKSGCRGEKGDNLTGVLDLYPFRPASGGLRCWFTLIGAQQADALILELQAARREADAGWKIQTVSIADAFTEGARRWGPNYRTRHTAPSVVKGVWGRPPALAWAMAANAPPTKPPPKTQAGANGAGASERTVGAQALPRPRVWEPVASNQTAASESTGTHGGVPDGRLDALAAEVAGVKSGQARLTQRVDFLQAWQEQVDRRFDGLETRQAAESAREAGLVKASLQAFAVQSQALERLANLSVQPRARGRSDAAPVASSQHSDTTAMTIEGANNGTARGTRRSRSPARSGSLSRRRVGDGMGADVTRVDGDGEARKVNRVGAGAGVDVTSLDGEGDEGDSEELDDSEDFDKSV